MVFVIPARILLHGEQIWILTFRDIQAIKVTAEECAGLILDKLPEKGGFFQVINSSWAQEIKQGRLTFARTARHFIVCGYDEIVEIIGTDPHFECIASLPQ